jgi:hypothetical protein
MEERILSSSSMHVDIGLKHGNSTAAQAWPKDCNIVATGYDDINDVLEHF